MLSLKVEVWKRAWRVVGERCMLRNVYDMIFCSSSMFSSFERLPNIAVLKEKEFVT